MSQHRLLLFLMIFPVIASGQCLKQDLAFRSGEHLSHKVYFHWGLLWLEAGELGFRVDTLTGEAHGLYHFTGTGNSLSVFDWFFRVRNEFVSHAGAGDLSPEYYLQNTSEGGFRARNVYHFDNELGTVVAHTESSRQPFRTDTLTVPPCTFDPLTAVYYTRSMDFSSCHPGDTMGIRMIIDNHPVTIHIRYHGREIVRDDSGRSYLCIRFSAPMPEGTIFRPHEELHVWVSDDPMHIPIKAEARIVVGSVRAYLSSWSGLAGELPVIAD
ncbi:MAG: DUF3108 domain-containing protein [Bacteroidales bacterium]|nr:DUF3108 domain-containing protein [Bacteroidales bacterium]